MAIPVSSVESSRREAPTASIDPLAVMRIKNLQLRATAVVEGFYNGLHRSPFHGFSVEFSEYRPYTVGDDLRGLDWKLYARTDRYYIKKFEDETNRRCYLVLDQSKSMGFGSLGYNKIEYAKTLVATMAYYLTLQRDSVGVMTFDERIGEFISAHNRQGHLRQIMVALSRPVAGSGTDLDQPLREIAAHFVEDRRRPVHADKSVCCERQEQVGQLDRVQSIRVDHHDTARHHHWFSRTGRDLRLGGSTRQVPHEQRRPGGRGRRAHPPTAAGDVFPPSGTATHHPRGA